MSEREHASAQGPSLTSVRNSELDTEDSETVTEHSETDTEYSELETDQSELETEQSEPETGQSASQPEDSELEAEPAEPATEHSELGTQAPEIGEDGPRDRSRLLPAVVAVTVGLGLLCEGFAMAVAPNRPALGQVLFFVGMVVPFAIFLAVLMYPLLGTLRVVTVAILGVYPSVVFRMSSPLVLPGYDEHLHEQELLNLLRGSGLLSGNPILKVGPFYPGLELFTGFAIRLTGLPPMAGMSLAVLLARLLLVLLIYYGALLVSPSHRGASLVVAFYAVSPQFYEFNSQFAYQTLAVTLGLGGLVLLRRAQLADGVAARRLSWAAWIALIATVFTHHVTGWLILAFIVCWAIMTPKGERKVVARGALVMGITAVAWTGALVAPLGGYFGPIFKAVLQSYTGNGSLSSSASAGSPPTPEWEKAALIFYVLVCSVAALTCAWIMFSRAFRNRDRILVLLGVCDLVFPLTDAAHFSPSVGAIGDRASTFLFFPLALSLSLVLLRHPRVARHPERKSNIFRPALMVALVGGTALVYLGGTLLGSSPDYSRLPGHFLVAADSRSQDPITLAAVKWASEHIAPGSTITADRDPAVLLTGQARLWPVANPQNNLEPAYLFFSTTWGTYQNQIVKGLHIDYIYVDKRLDESLPLLGYYFSVGEMPQPTRITAADVNKFARVPGLKAVYHQGPVTIYSTSGLGVVPVRKGFTGYHSMGAGPWDAVIGAAFILLLVLIRRRLAWVRPAARHIGALGTALVVIAGCILLGAVLFGLRVMPGPAFTLGAIAASAIVLVVHRRRSGQRLLPHLPFPRGLSGIVLSAVVLIGVVAGAAGLGIAFHAAWIIDMTDVNAILRSVS
jgi:hypothetical protein